MYIITENDTKRKYHYNYVNNENKKPTTQDSTLVTHESNKRTKSTIFKLANM